MYICARGDGTITETTMKNNLQYCHKAASVMIYNATHVQ